MRQVREGLRGYDDDPFPSYQEPLLLRPDGLRQAGREEGEEVRLTTGESNALRRGVIIAKKFRMKSEDGNGDQFWTDIKKSWDKLYYSVDDGPWCSTVGEAYRRRGEP